LTARQSHSLLDTSGILDPPRRLDIDELRVVAISIDG
jgi:hypothetical protein